MDEGARRVSPRIAIISAVPAAIAPAVSALAEGFPGAEAWNLLDDRLLTDASDGVDDRLAARMQRLIAHAIAEGADGILLTCSLYGEIARQVDRNVGIPVLAPDDAAFAELVTGGFDRILVVASFEGAANDSGERLSQALTEAGATSAVECVVAEDAMTATSNGDLPGLERALLDAIRPRAGSTDVVFLAQYSLAPAARALSEALAMPVVSGPLSSALRLAEQVSGAS
jgi:hypothetical protein